jgi:hypothetical protein
MVALLLLSIVLLGTTQAVLDLRLRARHVADRQAVAGERALADDVSSLSAWTWDGFLVATGVWESDSVLVVDVATPPREIPWDTVSAHAFSDLRARVAVWVDGWFAGQADVEAGKMARMGPGLPGFEAWPEFWDDAEVTVRARVDGKAWGAPWRTLAPHQFGAGPGVPREIEVEGVDQAAGVAVHAPVDGHTDFTVQTGRDLGSLTEVDLSRTAHTGGPLFSSLPSGCAATVEGEGRGQAFRTEPGRWVDVYF